ncbi:META domain-containing protein [Jiulongibacter sp. NS-SX5]|uniref:META domain-containing protein n=1 Tax=Jiulongibacter sp. NS-SX5 TaxID=3463854 RepID=UPI0040581F39
MEPVHLDGVPVGRYSLSFYENIQKVPYEVILDVSDKRNEDGDFLINGRSAVNFYESSSTIQTTDKQFKIKSLAATEIAGSAEELKFENEYFNRLLQVSHFELKAEGKTLVLFLNGENTSFMSFTLSDI